MSKSGGKSGPTLLRKVKWEDLWLAEPKNHDFPAAVDYLGLHYNEQTAKRLATELRKSGTVLKKAKDLMRASRLELLPAENLHVRENIIKVMQGTKLSPVLLVRGEPLVIADGYHRICAAYHLTEDLVVPCRLAGG